MIKCIYRIICFLLFVTITHVAWGAFPDPTGTWNAFTLDKNYTVNLTGNITIKGQITIPDGKTLTIKIANSHTSGVSGDDKHIKILANSADGFARMFLVEKGGKLVIEGRDAYTRIRLDGGARFTAIPETDNTTRPFYISGKTVKVKTHSTSGGKDVTQEAIRSNAGTLTLNWVTIENVWDQDINPDDDNDSGYGGAIYIYGPNYDGTKCLTTITNCIIQNCCDEQGSAIMLRTNNEKNDNNPNSYATNSKVTIKNTTIQYCYSTGNAAGTIRTNGRTINSLELDNVTIKNNYSLASGGGVYWNACGCGATKLTLKNCTITGNFAKSHGGGLHIATNVDFQGTNNIYNNHALSASAQGGGIRLFSYTGQTMPKEADGIYNFTYNLPEGLNIYNNSAAYGAGIAYNVGNFKLYSGWADDNHSNVKINVTMNLNGANIHTNTASLDGAGLWVANNTEDYLDELKKATINIIINFNEGTISNNTSSRNGAGVYIKEADITHVQANAGKLTISNNKTPSDKNGGGIYIESGVKTGKTINLSNVQTEISGNSAQNGAGIYLNGTNGVDVSLGESTITANSANNNGGALFVNGGSISMKKTTITGNSANKNGGAIFLQGGNYTTTAATSIKDNYSITSGGAIYVSGGSVSLNSPTITGNGKNGSTIKTGLGGAVYVTGTGSGFTATGTTTIQNNASITSGGGIYVSDGNVNMASSTISENQSKDGGGVYVLNGNFTTTGATYLESNTSTNNGGALFVQGGTTTLNTPTIINNSATDNGGAIYSTGAVTSNGKSLISGNSAKNGGAIYTTGSVELKGDLDMTNNKATGNTDSKGGGVYIVGNNSNFTVTGTSSISTNESTFEGGAIFVDGGNVSMGKTTLSGNKSQNGGAIYSSGAVTINGESTIEGNSGANGGAIYTTGSVELKGNSSMNRNTAAGDGGVMYVEEGNINSYGNSVTATGNKAVNGGVFRVKGSIELGYTVMENNTASANGGAVALYNGTFSMANNDGKGNSSSIVNNKATDGFGGGLYINSNSQTDITWDGGIFSNNTAKAGGAVAVDGPITLTFSATMENNIAEIGGGLYLKGATMNFGDGLVRGNKAEQPELNTTQYSTAMNLDASSVSGVGGGIFMASGATLNFTNKQNLGIYNNFATNAGADICANGNSTTLNLPNPNGLNLKGFDVPTDRLDWIEDYFNDETYISNKTSSQIKGIRYEKILQILKTTDGNDIEDYMIPYGDNESSKSFTNYICVDLGYDLVYVDLTVLGLKNLDHAAIICSYKDKTDNIIKEYRKILFTGNGEDGGVKRIVALPSGDWQFKASDWSYNYNSPAITAGVKGSSSGGSAITGDELIYISNKTEGDVDGGYNAISAKFEPKSNGETSQARVKQFQAEKVNRMIRN